MARRRPERFYHRGGSRNSLRGSGEIVALKKVPLKRLDDGLPNQVVREIKALQEIGDNPYVVKLKDMFPHGPGFVLVFEYMVSNLSDVIQNAEHHLSEAQVKGAMAMLLSGLAFCHKNCIMHRDLKPANLLVSSTGRLKIADFGQARLFSRDHDHLYSHQVATRWYRAPELLFGARKYDEGVDMWAVGCIFGELLNNSPLFHGESDIEQLCCIIGVFGTPNEHSWPEISELPDFHKITFRESLPRPLEEVVPDAPPEAVTLLQRFLLYPSRQRIRAADALLHPYFFTEPLPAHHLELPDTHCGSKPARGHRHQKFDVFRPISASLFDNGSIASFASM
uniref:Cyclin-dependent kinase 20 n=1 Tax=Eptatretus burgeri TaxID=7764 RepID=A0A8C4QJ43_EPTBU